MVQQLPAGSPLDRELNGDRPDWSTLHQVVDDSRRFLAVVAGVKALPPPHPSSPFATAKAKAMDPDRARRLAAARERARQRESNFERR